MSLRKAANMFCTLTNLNKWITVFPLQKKGPLYAACGRLINSTNVMLTGRTFSISEQLKEEKGLLFLLFLILAALGSSSRTQCQ